MSGIAVKLLACLVFLCLALTFRQASKLLDEHEERHKDPPAPVKSQPLHALGIVRLTNELMFDDTLKSCMPGVDDEGEKKKKCGTYIPDGSKERIGILAPPGTVADALTWLLGQVVSTRKRKDKPAKEIMEIIPTTHMAPYGYGKTHGWTRIVRVVPQPLIAGATDSLLSVVGTKTTTNEDIISKDSLTFDDLKASLRQQIRYHCRLNHISAHTAEWTVGLDDLASLEMDDVEEFVDWVEGYLDLEQPEDLEDNSLFFNKFDEENNVDNLYDQGAALLSLLQTKMAQISPQPIDMMKELDDVLLDEMRISKNLTAWPCESFWTVGEPNNRLQISPPIQRIAQQLSPDCSDPFVNCFVKKDKCEHAGDGKCS